MNVTKLLSFAKKINGYGFSKLADRVVTRALGPQIGKTSKSGYRGFASSKAEPIFLNLGIGRRIHEIENVRPEKVITVIDENYNLVGQTVIRKSAKNSQGFLSEDLTQIERRLYPKANDPAQTQRLDITQYLGLGKQPRPGDDVVSRHYISRKALEPEAIYIDGERSGICETGSRICDSFSYSYIPKDEYGNIKMQYEQIGDIEGGEKFYTRVRKMLDTWFEQRRVIRQGEI